VQVSKETYEASERALSPRKGPTNVLAYLRYANINRPLLPYEYGSFDTYAYPRLPLDSFGRRFSSPYLDIDVPVDVLIVFAINTW